MTIITTSELKTCVTQGEKPIPVGTVMTKYFSQLTWSYFKDEAGNTLIIMGYSSPDWSKVQILS